MVKIQQAKSQSNVALVDQMTILPPTTGDIHAISTSSSSNQKLLSSTVGSSISKIIPSSSSSPKETNSRSKTTEKKKTKSISKAQLINCDNGPKTNDDESDDEVHYDLQTCIEESGGLDRFLNVPCMILYKNNLKNQSDLKYYVLQHLSSYKGNVCAFAGIKGTDEMKNKIYEFYRQNRKTSMKSTILFKGHSSKTTATQQIFLRDGHLYLYVDAVMKNKTSRNKRKKVYVGSARGGVEEFDGKNRDGGINRKILASTKYSQNETYRNRNNKGEKTDVENVNNGSSAKLEGDEEESEPSANEDEISEEEAIQINTSTGGTRSRSINWRGGSKNTGVYLLYDKKQEITECVNNVLSYAREHGTLLTGTQLNTILDIENVEITKDRTNGLVQVISKCVDIITNPHFVPPTTKKPVFEYYGKNYELTMIHPNKPIPISSEVLTKYQKERNKKKKVNGGNESGNEEEPSAEMMEEKYPETYNTEDDNVMQKKINDENYTTSDDDEVEHQNEKLNELKNNSSPENSNTSNDGFDEKNQPLVNNSVLDEESIEKNIILQPPDHVEEVVNSYNDHGNDNVIIPSSPIAGKTNSMITIDTHSRSSSQATAASVTVSEDLSVMNLDSKLITTSSSAPLPSNSNTIQRSNSVESTSNTATSLEQHISPRQSKQKRNRMKKNTGPIAFKNNKRRSFFLRSKTRTKQQQLPIVTSSKRKQDGGHVQTTESTISLKKRN